jgi:hypothetical protein
MHVIRIDKTIPAADEARESVSSFVGCEDDIVLSITGI